MEWRTVAENEQLARVFRHMKAAALYLAKKRRHSDEPLHIPPLAPDHTALLHRFAAEQVIQPDLGREGRVAVLHGPQGGGGVVKGGLMGQLECGRGTKPRNAAALNAVALARLGVAFNLYRLHLVLGSY